MKHPREVLLGAQAAARVLPVCDHYSGVEVRMRKSLQLQAELHQEFGVGVMDVTLDCEDGAPVGGEKDHAELVVSLATSASSDARIAVRVHPLGHPAFEQDIAILVGRAPSRWCHIMLPKAESVADIHAAVQAIDAAGGAHLPLHALIESPLAVHNAFDIAAHPRVQSLSFGLMDFVSAHGGAVPASAMGAAGQFSHPLVVQAKHALLHVLFLTRTKKNGNWRGHATDRPVEWVPSRLQQPLAKYPQLARPQPLKEKTPPRWDALGLGECSTCA